MDAKGALDELLGVSEEVRAAVIFERGGEPNASNLPDDAAREIAGLGDAMLVYADRLRRGVEVHQLRAVMPGGDTRQSVFFRPYPLFLEGGEGAYVEDVDGNRYLDACNCWTAIVLGHAHPSVVEAVSRQLAMGTAFNAANRHAVELAELIADRVPSVEEVRFCNSGTEATMMAVRAARAFTGRGKIVKMQGAYHGSHDDFTVAYGEAPSGVMPGAAANVIEVEFNNKEHVSQVLEEHGEEVAAVIVEGLLGSAGMLPPEDGYLRHLRKETERHGALLIMDEVISLRLARAISRDVWDRASAVDGMAEVPLSGVDLDFERCSHSPPGRLTGHVH